MINSYDDLSPVQLDVLKEIGNIGSGNAATALSQLLGRSIDMQVPQVRLMDVADAIESLGFSRQAGGRNTDNGLRATQTE